MALFICLLILPGVLYLGLHALDFSLLSLSGSGNAWVSPQFQMTLKGHDVMPVMAGNVLSLMWYVLLTGACLLRDVTHQAPVPFGEQPL